MSDGSDLTSGEPARDGDAESVNAAGASRERQFVFDFPSSEQPKASFLVTEANRDAARLVSAPELWAPAACVVGPRGSGKTLLARDFFRDAHFFAASVLGQEEALPQPDDPEDAGLADAPARLLELVGQAGVGVVLDQIDDVFEQDDSSEAERALFHIFNRAAERGAKILLLARTPPARWPVALPDLRTRLRTAPVARIEGPDDALLAHLLRKRLSDLGFTIETPTIQYLLARLPRSFEAVEDAVRRVNERAWADDQALSIPFVRSALGF
ncbi:MAG: DnaA/Hda family protein [Neomegalonema sp.]|nr:DnaA/Hda family protein [Neomegalonema sp.]